MMPPTKIFTLFCLIAGCTMYNPTSINEKRTTHCDKFFNDISSFTQIEKKYLYKNKYDTLFNLNQLFAKLEEYRNKTKSYASCFLNDSIKNAFLIEHFHITSRNYTGEYLDCYSAILYVDNYNPEIFYNIDWNDDLSERRILNVELTEQKQAILNNWLFLKMDIPRIPNEKIVIDEDRTYMLCITKYTQDEKLTKIFFNPSWQLETISIEDHESDKFHIAITTIATLYFLTGNGTPI